MCFGVSFLRIHRCTRKKIRKMAFSIGIVESRIAKDEARKMYFDIGGRLKNQASMEVITSSDSAINFRNLG